MNAIGGYFELELNDTGEYHKDAIRLNTGRNALEYILLANNYRKIYIPYYTCSVLLQPLKKHGIEYEFYHIDEAFEPLFDYSKVEEEACFLYTNYFGVKDAFVAAFSQKCPRLIIDNSQSFYSLPQDGTDTFYSPRKFFGLPDGAYVYTGKQLDSVFGYASSWDKTAHLLRRIDEGAESGYSLFTENDASLNDQPIQKMSKLTEMLLKCIDYPGALEKRNTNFKFIHHILGKENLLNLDQDSISGPMIYPFWVKNGAEIKSRLISNRIYVPTYWTEVLSLVKSESLEAKLVKELVCIPIDQRLDEGQLTKIIEIIRL